MTTTPLRIPKTLALVLLVLVAGGCLDDGSGYLDDDQDEDLRRRRTRTVYPSTSPSTSSDPSASPSPAPTILGSAWYVSKSVATSGDGRSWQTAWKDTSSINWNVVGAGDVIFLDGGTSGMSYSAFSTGKGGAAGGQLTLMRSPEAGHDGTVTLSTVVSVQHPYFTIDGGDRDKLIINLTSVGSGAQGAVNISSAGDYFEIKNASLIGTRSASWGHSLGIAAKHALVSRCKFVGSVYEDQMNFTSSGGSLTIEYSLFLDNRYDDNVHRDVINPYVSGGYDLIIRGNVFQHTGDVFLLQNPSALGRVVCAYNIFNDTAYGLRFGTGSAGAASVELYNNIFQASSGVDFSRVTGTKTRANNVWNGGASFTLDSGAAVAPLFVDSSNVFGADGIAFTSDDGFSLRAGSPLINAGVVAGDESRDIRGSAFVGTRDVGAYEYLP